MEEHVTLLVTAFLSSSFVMNLFKKKPETIPPVTPPTDTPSGFRPLRSNASSYVASRDGDPYSTTSNYSRGDHDSQPGLADRYKRNVGVGDSYSRNEAQLEQDRNALFAGYNPAKAGSGRFFDGQSFPEQGEEDEEGIKQQTRFAKQETVSSSRNALRLAREAEETALNTVNRLGDQSGKAIKALLHINFTKLYFREVG